MTTKIHLAGNMIHIGGYFIQRCLLCGKSLLEGNARNMASPDGGEVSSLSVGAFYEFEEMPGVSRWSFIADAESTVFRSDLEVPQACCIRDIA